MDLPQFYLSFENKPLRELPIPYWEYGLKNFSKIHLTYVGLNGGSTNEQVEPLTINDAQRAIINAILAIPDPRQTIINTYESARRNGLYYSLPCGCTLDIDLDDEMSFILYKLCDHITEHFARSSFYDSTLEPPIFFMVCVLIERPLDDNFIYNYLPGTLSRRNTARYLLSRGFLEISFFNQVQFEALPFRMRQYAIEYEDYLCSYHLDERLTEGSETDDSDTDSEVNDLSNLQIQALPRSYEDVANIVKNYFVNLNDKDYYISLAEDCIILIYSLYCSFKQQIDYGRIMAAIAAFMKSRLPGKSLSSRFLEIKFSKFIESVTSEFFTQSSTAETVYIKVKSMREFIANYKTIKNSQFFKRMYKIYLYCLSQSLFESFGYTFESQGYTHFEKEAILKQNRSSGDMVYDIIDTIMFVCERGSQILLTGSFQTLFHSSSEYTKVFDNIAKLREQHACLHNPELFGFSESSFRADLDDTIEKLENMCKFSSDMNSIEKFEIKKNLNSMKMMRCEVTTLKAARADRDPPFSVLVCGGSGVGKTTIKRMLFAYYGNLHGLDTDDSFCYTRNPVAKFWDGFKTSQWGAVIDDAAFMNPKAAPQGDPSVMELIAIINGVSLCPDMAHLEDKGRVPFRCEWLVATTNTENLNAHFYFSAPGAVQRRLPWIIVPIVKPQYTNADGMLDSNKTPPVVEGQYPNYWHWTIRKVVPNGTRVDAPAIIEDVQMFSEVTEFLAWYGQQSMIHKKNMKAMRESTQVLKNIAICKTCFKPKNLCVCSDDLQLQSYTVTSCIGIAIWTYFTWNIGLALSFIMMYLLSVILPNYLLLRVYSWFCHIIGPRLTQHLLRRMYGSLGEKIQKRIGYIYHFGQIVLFLTTFAATIKASVWAYTYAFSGSKGEDTDTIETPLTYPCCGEEGSVNIRRCDQDYVAQARVDKGYKPLRTENERGDIYYQDNYHLSNYQISRQSTSSKGLSKTDFIASISNNIIHFCMDNRTKKIKSEFRGIALCGQQYLFNNHSVVNFESQDEVFITVIWNMQNDGVTSKITCRIVASMLNRFEKTDIAILTIPHLPPRKDLRNYFPIKPLEHCKNNGFLLSRKQDGTICINDVSNIQSERSNIPLENFDNDYWSYRTTTLTDVGDCGALLIAQTEMGYIMLGIHVAGNIQSNGVSTKIDLEKLTSYIGTQYVVQNGNAMLSAPGFERSIVDLHPKSPFRYLEKGSAEVFGSFDGFRPSYSSRVENTPMSDILLDYGYQFTCGPPAMRGWEPWYNNANKMVHPNGLIDLDILEAAYQSYVAKILDGIDYEQLKLQVHVLDMETAINGMPGVAYIDPIKINTSAGNPFKMCKQHLIVELAPDEIYQKKFTFDDVVMERVLEIIDMYEQLIRVFPNFNAALKDEAVTYAKIEAKKTRLFAGAPVDWSIVVRKYTLSLSRFITNFKLLFETCVGTIAQSTEWTDIYNHITAHGKDNMFAGDYENYDKGMSPVVILSAFRVLILLAELSGNYTESDLKVIWMIGMDTAFALYEFNGDLVMFLSSMPSGHPLTVIINSIVNSMYMRYAYHVVNPQRECLSFNDNVALGTYGDDNAGSVDRNKAPFFNHTTIQKALKSIGIGYTMADKTAESVPYISIEDVTFLKRSWVFNDELNCYLAPLEHESIEKSLMTWTRSKAISKENQAVDVITSAMREYFFYGRDVYEQKSNLLKHVVDKLDLHPYVHDAVFPTYNSLIEDFVERSKQLSH